MKKNIVILMSIVLIAIVGRFAFSMFGQIMTGKMMAKSAAPSVSLGEVQETQVIKQVQAPGRIVSKYRISVVTRIEGVLSKSYFKEGAYVKKGQVLFEIDPLGASLNVQKARATLANTKAQLVYAEKQLARSADLVKKDYISKSAYDDILSQRDALRAQLALNQANLNDSLRNYSYTRIKAPVDGQIGIINVTVGNYITPSTGTLTTINSTNPTFVTFPIDSKDYSLLTKVDAENVKRKVELFFPTGEKYELSGIQDFHDNNIDQSTGTITMRATFPNAGGRLINGEFVKVFVYSNNKVTVPIVPQVAVLENPQGKYVYTLNAKGMPEITMIKVSGQYNNNWIVDSGLKKGDKILVDGLQKVIPDRPVKVVDKVVNGEQKVKSEAKTSK